MASFDTGAVGSFGYANGIGNEGGVQFKDKKEDDIEEMEKKKLPMSEGFDYGSAFLKQRPIK